MKFHKLGNLVQNKKPLNLDDYRGITTGEVILITFYGAFSACKLSCVFFFDSECSVFDSSSGLITL